MPSTREEFRSSLKEAKRALKAGKTTRAEFWLQRTNELAGYLNDSDGRAFVLHRLAEVGIQQNQTMIARKRFKQALSLINTNDRVGYATLQRDYGNFERIQDNRKLGYSHVKKAIDTLDSIQNVTARVKLERIVTEGFAARFELYGPHHDDAIETLRITARKLYGCKKRQYELANLSCLVDVLPVWSPERLQYVTRAIELCVRLRNMKRAGEFAALLGGKTSRNMYLSVVN